MPRKAGEKFLPFIDHCLQRNIIEFQQRLNSDDFALRFDFDDQKFRDFCAMNSVASGKTSFTRNLTSYGFLKVTDATTKSTLYYSEHYQPEKIDREELIRLCRASNAKANENKRQRNQSGQTTDFINGTCTPSHPVTPLKRTRRSIKRIDGAKNCPTPPESLAGMDVSVSGDSQSHDRLEQIEQDMRALREENAEIKHDNRMMKQEFKEFKDRTETTIKLLTEENQRLMNSSKLSNGPIEPNGLNAPFAAPVDLMHMPTKYDDDQLSQGSDLGFLYMD